MSVARAVGHEIAHVASMVSPTTVVRRNKRMVVGARGIKMSAGTHCLGRVPDVAKLVDMEAMLAGGEPGYICDDFHSAIGRGERDDPCRLISGRVLNDGDG